MTFRIRTDYFQFIRKDIMLYSNLQRKLALTYETKRYLYPIKLFIIVITHQSNQKKIFCNTEQLGR